MLVISVSQNRTARKVLMKSNLELFKSTVPHAYEWSMTLASIDEQTLAGFVPKDKLPPRFEAYHPKRRKEYLAGRYCAAQALAIMSAHRQYLIKDKILTVGENRVPNWPEGVRGTISHSDDLVGAMVVSREEFLGVGLDYERLMTDERASRLARRIVSAEEWRKCQSLVSENYPLGYWLTLCFSAKECLYKAIYPIHGEFVGFQEVELTELNAVAGRFGYRFLTKLKAPLPEEGQGVFQLVERDGLPATMAAAIALPMCGSGL